MNYDFYAYKEDKKQILDFIFEHLQLHVYEAYSGVNQSLKEYESSEQLMLDNNDLEGKMFRLWHHNFGSNVVFEKIELMLGDYRYASRGWGMINLYFSGLKDDKLYVSYIGHFNEKGALKVQTQNHINGQVSQWNWKEINRVSRKLKYNIENKMAVRKKGRFPILKKADEISQNKAILMHGNIELDKIL